MTEETQAVNPILEEMKNTGPNLMRAAVLLSEDDRAGNLTAPDHMEILYLLIDPNRHDVYRDPGVAHIGGAAVTVRGLTYARHRVYGVPITEKSAPEAVAKATTELDLLQQKLLAGVKGNKPGSGQYLRFLTKFAGLFYLSTGQPPLQASIDYLPATNDTLLIGGLNGALLPLGRPSAGIAEIGPGLRGIATIQSAVISGMPVTLIDSNHFVAATLKDYARFFESSRVRVVEDDAAKTRTLAGFGSILASGLHHLSEPELTGVITNIAGSLPPGGLFYFRDSEHEHPGMRDTVGRAMEAAGLTVTHTAIDPKISGFEFVAAKS